MVERPTGGAGISVWAEKPGAFPDPTYPTLRVQYTGCSNSAGQLLKYWDTGQDVVVPDSDPFWVAVRYDGDENQYDGRHCFTIWYNGRLVDSPINWVDSPYFRIPGESSPAGPLPKYVYLMAQQQCPDTKWDLIGLNKNDAITDSETDDFTSDTLANYSGGYYYGSGARWQVDTDSPGYLKMPGGAYGLLEWVNRYVEFPGAYASVKFTQDCSFAEPAWYDRVNGLQLCSVRLGGKTPSTWPSGSGVNIWPNRVNIEGTNYSRLSTQYDGGPGGGDNLYYVDTSQWVEPPLNGGFWMTVRYEGYDSGSGKYLYTLWYNGRQVCGPTNWVDNPVYKLNALCKYVHIMGQNEAPNQKWDVLKIGADYILGGEPVTVTIEGAKDLPDNTQVTINSALVTLGRTTYFYIESDDRTSGIRVNWPDNQLIF